MKTKTSNQNQWMKNIFRTSFIITVLLITSISFSSYAQNNCKDLLRAVKSNNITKVVELIQTVNPDCVFRGDGEPRSSLVAAARNGNLAIVKLLLTAKANVEFHAKGDESPLIAASKAGHIETVKYIISQGADINAQIDSNGTALIASVKNGHYDVTKILLKKGADPCLTTSGDEYPMYHAQQLKDNRMITLLETYAKTIN